MGSIVLSDVVHHFPHGAMFGAANQHHESPAPSIHTISATSRHSESEAHNQHLRESVDVPMTDAVPHSTTSGTPERPSSQQQQQQHRGSVQSGGLTPHGTSSQTPQLPKSPRFRGFSSQQTPTLGFPNPQAAARQQTGVSPNTSAHPSPSYPLRSPVDSTNTSPRRIKVQSLSHIQSFANDKTSPFSVSRALSRRSRRNPDDIGPQYEISDMPVTDIIEMVAGLLTKITTTNDRQHEHLHRQIPPPEGTNNLSQQTTSVLAFHGKNVPSISILSYLSRIHKYCPTTYEVFLSLLVYFDRMTERVNSGPMQSLRQANQHSLDRAAALSEGSRHSSVSTLNRMSPHVPAQTQAATPPPSGSLGKPAETGRRDDQPPTPPSGIEPPLDSDPYNLSHFFVVDSYNIHRLVIAGVTCASKFFSDIFYTNSRYAKVGGLPLVELNHLELQFLLLNDFRLAVPLEEMEAYGTMLVEFYAREVVAQKQIEPLSHSGAGLNRSFAST